MHTKNSSDVMRQHRDISQMEQICGSYMLNKKQYIPAECTGCGAIYKEGRWQWASKRIRNTNKQICPACQRVENNIPAGILTLSGKYFEEKKDDILKLVGHEIFLKESDNPLERIIEVVNMNNGDVTITFTDNCLPHRIGAEIKKAHKGMLAVQHPPSTEMVYATWTR